MQTNNPTEEILRKRSDGEWLLSCGPTAAVTCIATMGFDVCMKTQGNYLPQSEEVLVDFFNDPRNYSALQKARPETPPAVWHANEVPQFYPVAVSAVFGVKARFVWGAPFETVVSELQNGKAVQLCLKKPGHYIVAVAYDDEKDEIIFNAPYPSRFKDGYDFNRRLSRADFSNVKPFRIVYDGAEKPA